MVIENDTLKDVISAERRKRWFCMYAHSDACHRNTWRKSHIQKIVFFQARWPTSVICCPRHLYRRKRRTECSSSHHCFHAGILLLLFEWVWSPLPVKICFSSRSPSSYSRYPMVPWILLRICPPPHTLFSCQTRIQGHSSQFFAVFILLELLEYGYVIVNWQRSAHMRPLKCIL